MAEIWPRDDLASTGYCLAGSGRPHVVCLPEGGKVAIDLSGVSGPLAVEWIEPVGGKIHAGWARSLVVARSF